MFFLNKIVQEFQKSCIHLDFLKNCNLHVKIPLSLKVVGRLQ